MEQLYLTPPTMLADGYSAVAVWIELDSGARFWSGSFERVSEMGQTEILDQVIERHRNCAARLRDFPVERWIALGNAVGWPPFAVAAMSWCAQAQLPQVLQYWRALGQFPAVEPGADFAARLLNPALLPENRLTTVIEAAGGVAGACLLIAARSEPPVLDVEPNRFADINPRVGDLIRARQKESLT